MAGTFFTGYGTSNQALTITLASLANSDNFVARESTAVDNSSTCAIDALVVVRCEVGTVAAPKLINIYAYGSVDGSNYTGKATGSDAAYGAATNQCIKHLVLIGNIIAETNSAKNESRPMSVANAFGGTLPTKWGIVVQNISGAALASGTNDNCAKYQLIYGSYT